MGILISIVLALVVIYFLLKKTKLGQKLLAKLKARAYGK